MSRVADSSCNYIYTPRLNDIIGIVEHLYIFDFILTLTSAVVGMYGMVKFHTLYPQYKVNFKDFSLSSSREFASFQLL